VDVKSSQKSTSISITNLVKLTSQELSQNNNNYLKVVI